jgi:hypothetical protein
MARRAGAIEFVLSSALMLALLFLSTVLLSRHDVIRDFSADQRRTLAPQTLQVLDMIERPIQITAFYTEDPQEQARLLNLVDRFREKTTLIDLRFADVDRRPELAAEYGVSTNRTVVLEDGDLRVRVSDPDEAALSAGIIRVLRAEPPMVFFVTGHGEASVEDESGAGLMDAGRMLLEQNFELRTMNTALVDRVPESASLLVLAGPQSEYTDREVSLIDDYLMRGGRLLAAVEPGGARSVDSLLTRWGIEPGDGYVIDASDEQRNLLGGQEEPLIGTAESARWSGRTAHRARVGCESRPSDHARVHVRYVLSDRASTLHRRTDAGRRGGRSTRPDRTKDLARAHPDHRIGNGL